MSPTTDRALTLLSAVPWFNDSVAAEVLETDTEGGQTAVRRFAAVGLLHRKGSLMRVHEPLRTELRDNLAHNYVEEYQRKLAVFVAHAQNAMRKDLERVLGDSGASLTISVTAAIAHPEDVSRMQAIVNEVRYDHNRRESRRAQDAALLFNAYGTSRSRASTFFEGIALWNENRRVEAKPKFEEVQDSGGRDILAAISGHLVGVSMYGENQLPEAISTLQHAIEILRELEDPDGLAMTLSSLGRAYRQSFRDARDPVSLEYSIQALEEAANLVAGRSRGKALQYLAQAYAEAERYDDAISAGIDAVQALAGLADSVEAHMDLALVYRRANFFQEYSEHLRQAEALADSGDLHGQALARLLNMAAANERRLGDRPRAERLARKSVLLGRNLNDSRHVAHSSHTLAAILIDGLAGGANMDAAEIRDLLRRSRATLVALRDRSGVAMVDETTQRFELVAAEKTGANADRDVDVNPSMPGPDYPDRDL